MSPQILPDIGVHSRKDYDIEWYLCCDWGVILRGVIQKPTFWSYFSTKRTILTPGFGDITRDKLEFSSNFLNFSNNENKDFLQHFSKFIKIYFVVLQLNVNFRDTIYLLEKYQYTSL
jgi:hypothetical protein